MLSAINWINILNNVYYYIKNSEDRQAFFKITWISYQRCRCNACLRNWQQKIVYQYPPHWSRVKWIFTENNFNFLPLPITIGHRPLLASWLREPTGLPLPDWKCPLQETIGSIATTYLSFWPKPSYTHPAKTTWITFISLPSQNQ